MNHIDSPDHTARQELKALRKRLEALRDKPTLSMTLDEHLDHQRRVNELTWKLKARAQKPVKDMAHTDNITIER
jgi:hypothetical protein